MPQVDVEPQSRIEALHRGDRAGLRTLVSLLFAQLSHEGEDAAQNAATHLAQQRLARGEQEADLVRQRQDPLADGDVREDVIDQMGRRV
jgi:hypothetical protein